MLITFEKELAIRLFELMVVEMIEGKMLVDDQIQIRYLCDTEEGMNDIEIWKKNIEKKLYINDNHNNINNIITNILDNDTSITKLMRISSCLKNKRKIHPNDLLAKLGQSYRNGREFIDDILIQRYQFHTRKEMMQLNLLII